MGHIQNIISIRLFQNIVSTCNKKLLAVKLLLSVLLFSHVYLLNANSIDTTNTDTIDIEPLDAFARYYYEKDFMQDSFFFIPDTTLNHYQNYQPSYSNFNYPISNLGSAHRRLLYKFPSSIGFDMGKNAMNDYIVNRDKIHYYQVERPFTEAFYVNGSKKEEMFSILHTQNIAKNFNVGIDYNKIRSEGFYSKQLAKHSNLVLQSNFKTNNDRYGVLAAYMNSTTSVEENGGISNDSLFENGTINRKIMSLKLYNASNFSKGKSFFLKQYYAFGHKENIEKNDSIVGKNFVPTNRFSYTLLIERKRYRYKDEIPDSAYYTDLGFNYDTIAMQDSIYFSKVENELNWTLLANKKDNKPRKLLMTFSIKHQLLYLHQDIIDTTFSNLIAKGSIYNNADDFHYNLNGSYVVSGYNKGDYQYNLLLKKNINPLNAIHLHASLFETTPEFQLLQYTSDFTKWAHTTFAKTNGWKSELFFESTKVNFKVGADYSIVNHYIYYDTTLFPVQAKDPVNILRVYLLKEFKFGKWHFDNQIFYQKANSEIIRLPEWVTRHSLYYENKVFKKAVLLKTGIDVSYNSAYYADAYIPVVQQFYLQNEKKIGDYPYFDVFLCLKIKTARIFIKAEHVNAGLMGSRYYMTPHYPSPDRALKAGINWRFNN